MKFVALLLLAAPLALADLVINNAAGTIFDNDTTGITIESFTNTIFVHADAGEVELEGGEIHIHTPGEVHLEGELGGHVHVEGDGFILIESRDRTHIDGSVTLTSGLGTSQTANAACGATNCPPGRVVTGIIFNDFSCFPPRDRLVCSEIGVLATKPFTDQDLL